MNINRKQFLKRFSSLGMLIGAGALHHLNAKDLFESQDKVKFRFIVASDAHYGQPETPYQEMAETFISKANAFHQRMSCDFCVLNGDIIHDEASLMPEAKKVFKKLKMPLHVVQGNHDMLTATAWEEIWGKSVNYSFTIEDYKCICVTTSNETGKYLSPDLNWLEQELKNSTHNKALLFVHIPQSKWTKHAIDTPKFFDVLAEAKNVKAVFHGHEHDQDGIFKKNEIPFVFDSHIGGSWGTSYKGFRVVEVLNNDDVVSYMMDPDVAFNKNKL